MSNLPSVTIMPTGCDRKDGYQFSGGVDNHGTEACIPCRKTALNCQDPLWFSRPDADIVAGVFDGTGSQRGPVNMPISALYGEGMNSVDELIRQPMEVQQQYYWDFVPSSGSWNDSAWPASSYSTDVWF